MEDLISDAIDSKDTDYNEISHNFSKRTNDLNRNRLSSLSLFPFDSPCGSEDNLASVENDNNSLLKDWCVLNSKAATHRDCVTPYLEENEMVIVENHFNSPKTSSDSSNNIGATSPKENKVNDPLAAPKDFPIPVQRYTLKEASIVWCLYGGHDFLHSSSQGSGPHDTKTYSWKQRGGRNRTMNTSMEFHLTKMRFRHEIYPECTEQASRQILVIEDGQILDRLASSQYNKFLYQYENEKVLRPSNSAMVTIKAICVRPDFEFQHSSSISQPPECNLKVSILPLRLNVDQDAIVFLKDFFQDVTASTSEPETVYRAATSQTFKNSSNCSPQHLNSSRNSSSPSSIPSLFAHSHSRKSHDYEPYMRTPPKTKVSPQAATSVPILDDPLVMFDELNEQFIDTSSRTRESSSQESLTDMEQPLFFRTCIFSPEVPIRLDYRGKHFDMEQGTLVGLIVGLAQLNCSELKLIKLHNRKGLLGTERLIKYALREWLSDIKSNQLPNIIGGIGPMYSLVQLFSGIGNLFWMPVSQYRKDGRVMTGVRRGASAFTTSTAVAVLDLSTRFVGTVQYCAEVTYDMLSPRPSSIRSSGSISGFGSSGALLGTTKIHPDPPADIREGFTNAVDIITEGFVDTAKIIVKTATREHEQKGIAGATGSVVRQIPSAMIQPVVLATQATGAMLDGVRNQFHPNLKQEERDKWKTPSTMFQ